MLADSNSIAAITAGLAAHGADIGAEDARRVLDACPIGVFVIQGGHVMYANPAMTARTGRTRAQILGLPVVDLVAASHRQLVTDLQAGRGPNLAEHGHQMRGLRPDGSEYDVEVRAQPSTFRGRAALIATLTDVDALNAMSRRAAWNAAMLGRTESLCRSGSFQVRIDDGSVQLSPGLMSLAGAEGDDTLCTLDALPWVPADEQAFVAGIWRSARPGEPFEFQHRLLRRDGQRLIVLHRGQVDLAADQSLVGVAFVQDITAQREAEERAQELATHDEVTGLPNRVALFEKLEADMLAAGWEGKSVALLAIDLPRIAEVKTKMGFGAGDALAMATAARLSSFCAEGEYAAQLSDTEFVLTIEGPAEADVPAIQARARALQDVLHAPVALGATPVFPLSVIGLSGFPGDGQDPAALLEAAQTARLGATAENSIAQCSPGSNARAVREMAIEAALRSALEADELTLHYQPQVDLANGQVVGAEALLRWESATLGQVSPAEFIPVAEQSGLIGAIGDWVLERACRQLVAWRQEGLPAVRVGVNLSPTQLQRPNLAGWIQALLLKTGAAAECLGVELTEGTAMVDVDQARATLAKIRALGVEVSLDDFGTGYSSLSCLRRLPVDIVKIDRSFVHDVTASAEDMSVTRSIIAMVHGLHMRVLAEGVENESQLGLLASHGCDLIQGFLFSRALAPEDFAALVLERRRLPARYQTHVRRMRTLLLVDDEANILASLRRLLRGDGYTIVTAGSGEDALNKLAEVEADVIVSDQRMPGMSGVEFLQRARELYPDSVRMVLSGYTDLQSVIDAVNAGAVYKFLTKPWDDALLREHVAEAFRRKAIDDENRRLALQLEGANAEFTELNTRLERMVEQQRHQADLFARSAGQLREMLDSLPMPVFGIDADGVLVFGNREAQPLLEAGARADGIALGLPAPAVLRATIDGAGPDAVVLDARPFRVLVRPLPGQSAQQGQLLLLMPATVPAAAS